MRFHVRFTYGTENREKALQLLRQGALKAEASVKAERAWVAIGSGIGFAILETSDDKALYELAVTWSDFGELEFTPIIEVKSV
jgi:mannose-1-phosphate guanylyltransferase